MGVESRSHLSKGSSRKRPYGVLLLLVLGATLLSVAVLHKLRERRVLRLLVLDQERDLLALQVLLQREREKNKRARSGLEESREKIMLLNQQKLGLQSKLMETEARVAEIKRRHKEMEAALEEKENQIEQLIQRSSESAETTNHRVSDLTQLLREKEDEIERMRKQKPAEEDQVPTSRNEAWVKLETNVEDEGLRGDESGSNQDNQNAIDEHGKPEGEGREIEELQGTDQSTSENGGSKQELESSQLGLLLEENTASDGVDPTTAERPKTSHRRRRGRRTKAKSRRRRESEKQETAEVEDRKEEPADGGAVNGEILETTTAILDENKTSSETMEIEADTKREDDNHETKREEVILTEKKVADSAASGDQNDDDEKKEPNEDDPGKNPQEETAIAGHEQEA